ncbi:MAG TPA: M1 family aminopeptidase [Ignavibacteria bacterium]|jgi:aminopeptidase N
MQNPERYKKGTLIFTFGIIFNLLLSVLLFGGANFIAKESKEKSSDLIQMVKQQGTYVAQRLFGEFQQYMSGADDKELREEDPAIVASQNSYDVLHYDLALSFNVEAKTINGELYMHAASINDTLTTVFINLYDNLKVNSVEVASLNKHLTGEDDIRTAGSFSNAEFLQNKNYVIVNMKEKLNDGKEFVIRIDYSGSPKRLGFDSFSFKKIHDLMCIYNLSEPNYGPTWWPSKDLPDDKALLSVRLKVPTGFKGVSNGLLRDTVPNGDGTTNFNWKTTYPISTYLVSIVVSPFAYWEQTYTSLDGNKQMPVTYYVFPKDSAKSVTDWSVTPEMIGFLARTFGEYPFIDEKYGMAQFGWTSGAMEHQTITSMGYLLITGDRQYDNVVVHELSHHWFGDAVTLKNWKNIWLNEGFASYCEALWEENQEGKSAYFAYMKNFDYGYFSGTVYAPEGFIDNYAVYATVYQKGAWVLHMLRSVVGDSIFFTACRNYFERYKYMNAETSDLIAVFEEASGQKLDWFFDQWVYKGTGRPKYEYSWRFEEFQDQKGSGLYTVRLQLNQVQKDDLPVYKMPLNVMVNTKFGEKEFTIFNDSREQSFQFTVDSEPKEILIDKEGWVLKKIAKGTYEK